MYNGIVLVDKPAGLTSFDVVAKLRKIFQQKQVGHTGTLDPSVTGLLVIVLGKATKLIDYLQENQKQYRGTLILGLKTDTQDMDGQVTEMQFLKEAIADFKKKPLSIVSLEVPTSFHRCIRLLKLVENIYTN